VKRFLAGLVAGAAASGITYAITQAPPWWWVIGLVVAYLVWFGEALLDPLPD
jgi:uncharacterized RDD family membrane protein YckC